jgi:exonuclease VII small subunit
MTSQQTAAPETGAGAAAEEDDQPVTDLSYADAGTELDGIIEEFEAGVIDVDRLVERLQRATSIVDELDRRLRRTRLQVEELVPRLEAIGRADTDGGRADTDGGDGGVDHVDHVDHGDGDGDGDGQAEASETGQPTGGTGPVGLF